jgi:NADPH2:quinone reductase
LTPALQRYGETLRRDPDERERIWKEIEPLIESGKIKPTVGKRYQGLESVPQALQDIADRKIMGKAIIDVGKPMTAVDGTRPRL